MMDVRRALLAVILSCAVVLTASPAMADGGRQSPRDGGGPIGDSQLTLAYNFSDNSDAASVSGGPFRVIVDVVNGRDRGFIKVVAVAPRGSRTPNLVCSPQRISDGAVECSLAFSVPGTWTLRALYLNSRGGPPQRVSLTNITVGS